MAFCVTPRSRSIYACLGITATLPSAYYLKEQALLSIAFFLPCFHLRNIHTFFLTQRPPSLLFSLSISHLWLRYQSRRIAAPSRETHHISFRFIPPSPQKPFRWKWVSPKQPIERSSLASILGPHTLVSLGLRIATHHDELVSRNGQYRVPTRKDNLAIKSLQEFDITETKSNGVSRSL